MDLNYSRTEKIVGLFTISVAILLLTTVILIGRGKDWFKKYVTYYTTFEESYGLQTNSAVKLFKTDIGKVKKITLVGDRVEMKLAILEEFAARIRSDSVATVESPTFIGDEYVSIRPGAQSASLIPENGMIPSRAKRSIADVMAEFEVEKTAKNLVKAIQDLSEMVARLKDPKGPLFNALENLRQTTAHIEAITQGIEQGEGSAGSLLKSRELVESVQDKLARIGRILDSVAAAADKTPGTVEKVNENLDGVRRIEDQVSGTIETVRTVIDQIGGAVATLRQILENIEAGSQDVPEITRRSRDGLKAATRTVEEIDKVVRALQKNFLVRPNIPASPEPEPADAGVRP